MMQIATQILVLSQTTHYTQMPSTMWVERWSFRILHPEETQGISDYNPLILQVRKLRSRETK